MLNSLRHKRKVRFLSVMAAVLVMAALLPFLPVKADDTDFTAEMKVGFDNKAEMQKYVPFAVTITNNTNDFSGRLQVIVANKVNYNILYETDFSIAKGEKKTANFACKVIDNYGKVCVQLVDKKGKVIWRELKRFNVDKNASRKIDIAVLSDDFAALSYMDNIAFYDSETFETNLVELTADTFPEDVNSLDMIEIIIISNFSTDILTDEQMAALSLWINRGGMLIVGTGSNSSKTLSKLNGHIIEVQAGKLTRYSTSFGLDRYGLQGNTGNTGNYNNNNNNPKSPYDDEDFMEFFEDYYYNYRDDIDSWFLEDYMASEGLTEDDLDDEGKLLPEFEEDYYEFVLYTLYGYEYEDAEPDYPQYYYTQVAADVLDFTDSDSRNMEEEIIGDSTAGDYSLAKIYRRANGYIALYGVDFTMNPIPGYQDSSEIIGYLINKYVLKGVVEHYNNVSNSNYYNVNFNSGMSGGYAFNNFMETISAAPLPPVIFYVVPIIAYFVAVLVLYLVNKKRNRTFRLWYWYPVMAIGVAVLVFCIGFSTRIIRPRINTATIVDLQSPAMIESNYVAVTTPSNKTTEVGFSNEYDLQLIKQINGYFDNSDKVDPYSYRVGFRHDVDQTFVRFTGNVALSSDQFVLQTVYPSNRTFEAQYVQNATNIKTEAEKLILKNETGVDLENVAVLGFTMGSPYYRDCVVYRVGDMKSGASFDLSGVRWGTDRQTGYNAKSIFADGERHLVGGFLLGDLSEGFDTYQNRMNVADYIIECCEDEVSKIMNSSSSSNPQPDWDEFIYVIGFPKESICKEVHYGNKYRTERTEVVIQKIYLSDMQQVVKK